MAVALVAPRLGEQNPARSFVGNLSATFGAFSFGTDFGSNSSRLVAERRGLRWQRPFGLLIVVARFNGSARWK